MKRRWYLLILIMLGGIGWLWVQFNWHNEPSTIDPMDDAQTARPPRGVGRHKPVDDVSSPSVKTPSETVEEPSRQVAPITVDLVLEANVNRIPRVVKLPLSPNVFPVTIKMGNGEYIRPTKRIWKVEERGRDLVVRDFFEVKEKTKEFLEGTLEFYVMLVGEDKGGSPIANEAFILAKSLRPSLVPMEDDSENQRVELRFSCRVVPVGLPTEKELGTRFQGFVGANIDFKKKSHGGIHAGRRRVYFHSLAGKFFIHAAAPGLEVSEFVTALDATDDTRFSLNQFLFSPKGLVNRQLGLVPVDKLDLIDYKTDLSDILPKVTLRIPGGGGNAEIESGVVRFISVESKKPRVIAEKVKTKKRNWRLRMRNSSLSTFIDDEMILFVDLLVHGQRYFARVPCQLRQPEVLVSADQLHPAKNLVATLRPFSKLAGLSVPVKVTLSAVGGDWTMNGLYETDQDGQITLIGVPPFLNGLGGQIRCRARVDRFLLTDRIQALAKKKGIEDWRLVLAFASSVKEKRVSTGANGKSILEDWNVRLTVRYRGSETELFEFLVSYGLLE